MSIVKYHNLAESKNQIIQFTSISTGVTVSFPAFVEQFSDQYMVSWGTENSFGRVDPVKPYQSTTRRIQASITILAPNLEKGRENLTEYSKLIQMLYPLYGEPMAKGNSLGRTIKAPPILRIKMMNYIQSPIGDEGLLGCISGLTFNPNFQVGHFIEKDGTIIPKTFRLNFNFDPQHDSELGFNDDGNFLSSTFPYGRDQVTNAIETSNPNSQDHQAARLTALGN